MTNGWKQCDCHDDKVIIIIILHNNMNEKECILSLKANPAGNPVMSPVKPPPSFWTVVATQNN